jgi:hypothetical protein
MPEHVTVCAHTIEEVAEIVAETRHFRPDLLMRRLKK